MTKATSAYNWQAYANRQSGLLLLREHRVRVDTTIETSDGYLDHVHWQAIIALCPRLVAASRLKWWQSHGGTIIQHLELPEDINGSLARKLVDCAYGQKLMFSQQRSLGEFYTLATKYQIGYSIRVCLDFAQTFLDVDNCIQLFLLSLKHRHHKLRRASYSMIRSNFKQILFLNLDFHLLHRDDFKRLLLDNHLNLDEDEELVWVAILKWISNGEPSKLDLLTTYNRMIGPGRPVDLNLNNLKKQSSSQNQLETPFDFNQANGSNKRRNCNRKRHIEELLRCLRFLRFKSVGAFHVILSSKLIQADHQLVQLVQYMMLRYILRKKIPIDKRLIKQLLPVDGLKRIKNSETSRQERMIKSARKFIQCSQLFPIHQFNQMMRGDMVVAQNNNEPATIEEQNDPESKPKEKQIVRLDEQVLDKIDHEWMHRAKEPRVPSSVALLFGGWRDGCVTNVVLAYDFVCDRWFKLNIRLPEPRAFHVSCSSPKSGQIFIMGGTDGKAILNSVLRFDPAKDVHVKRSEVGGGGELSYKFRSLCPMQDRRCHLSGVFHTDGRLYALGGHNGHQRLRSGEWFDPNSNQWHPIADMTIARSDASACSHENKIFIAGGQIGDQYIQASVEFYKPNDNTWTFAAPMIVPRMSFKLVSHRSHLLAIGGTNGLMGGDEIGSVTRSVEHYNTHQASWSLCTPMVQKRASFGTIQVGNNLIVVGGNGGHRRLKTCELLKIASTTSASRAINTGGRAVQSPIAPPPRPPPPPPPQPQQLRQPLGLLGLNDSSGQNSSLRSAMKWVTRANLPTKHSGFSIAVVDSLKNSRDFTYHGLLGKSLIMKQKTYWHRFKIIKRRKLIKHLKIALVVTAVILIM